MSYHEDPFSVLLVLDLIDEETLETRKLLTISFHIYINCSWTFCLHKWDWEWIPKECASDLMWCLRQWQWSVFLCFLLMQFLVGISIFQLLRLQQGRAQPNIFQSLQFSCLMLNIASSTESSLCHRSSSLCSPQVLGRGCRGSGCLC